MEGFYDFITRVNSDSFFVERCFRWNMFKRQSVIFPANMADPISVFSHFYSILHKEIRTNHYHIALFALTHLIPSDTMVLPRKG